LKKARTTHFEKDSDKEKESAKLNKSFDIISENSKDEISNSKNNDSQILPINDL